MRTLFVSILLFICTGSFAQKNNYNDSLKKFQENYVLTHEVVKKADRKYFKFFPVNIKYRVIATFEKINDTKGFIMKTSGIKTPQYFKYGILTFTLDKKEFHLTIYQNEKLQQDDKYKDYLFVPFTDMTTGDKSYGGGKYLDFVMGDIVNNTLVIDFNKAYNPYCAYASGYNCPIPPRENDLVVAIKAGEMNFEKSH